MKAKDSAAAGELSSLVESLTLDEKLHVMSGDTPFLRGLIGLARAYNVRPLPHGVLPERGIDGVLFTDGPRGVVMYESTCFPVAMARGASWDVELEERVGDVIGVEARSQGANFFAGVCVNVLRHPAWGRAQETFGEDPYHVGEMGAALIRGAQRHVMACVKHFACNSIENARFRVDVSVDQRALHEVYLRQFKRCVDEGVAAVMSAYNKLNGEFCGHNRPLLTDVLKEDWGFEGFVISDFVLGVRDGAAGVTAGLDLEAPLRWRFGRPLARAVSERRVPLPAIDEAVTRIVGTQRRFREVGEPDRYGAAAVACAEHRALAREVASKSIVLLKNEPAVDAPLLPLDAEALDRVAVVGKLAAVSSLGDHGSSRVRPPNVVAPLDGIRAACAGRCKVDFADGSDADAAERAAEAADVVVAVVGYTHRDEGEYVIQFGGDRDSLTLRPRDEELIERLVASSRCVVVVLMAGSAVVTEAWRDRVPAIAMAWYPGMEGGHAIADVLFGAVNPSGKLPIVFPRSAAQLPHFDKRARSIRYDLYHGYRLLDRDGEEPAFAFGYGLSYTSYRYADLRVSSDSISTDATATATVDVTNTGGRAGDEVVQLYVGYPRSAVERAPRELKGFRRVALEPGETKSVELELKPRDWAYYRPGDRRWVVEETDYEIEVGPSSRAADLLRARVRVGAAS